MGTLVEVQGLTFRYPDGTQALSGVNFRLEEGDTVALLGANGSGKTTFVLHLVGLLEGEGKIEICGLPGRKENWKEIRRRVGLVFQESDEQLFMPTVLEDVAYGPQNLGLSPGAAVECAREALRQVGLEGLTDRAPYHLSAGEKRRAAIAGILAMNPEILILDEPTVSLDPPGQRDLVRLLAGLPQAKLLITHDTAVAVALATRAVFFDKGRIVAEGSVRELVDQFGWDRSPHRVPPGIR